MIYLGKFCCVCLDVGQKLEKLLIIQENVSYYDKLSILVPEMNINKIKKIAFICNDCKERTDNMFEFRTTCLRNNKRLQKYISQLNLDDDIGKITSELMIVKQEMEIDDFRVNDLIMDLNQNNQNILPFEEALFIECKKEIDIQEYIKTEILDDSIIEQYQLDSTQKIKTKRDIDNNIKTEINENVEDLTSLSNNVENIEIHSNFKVIDNIPLNIEIDIDCIKKETFNDDISNKSITPEYLSENVDNKLYSEIIVKNNDITSDICDINVNTNKTFDSNFDNTNDIYGSEDLSNTNNIPAETNKETCDICNKTGLKNLKRHKRNHSSDKPYKCEICSKSFIKFSDFNNHQRVHTGEKPYKCEICKKSFATSGVYYRHKRIHTGEKPFKCEICNKSFTQSSQLKSHTRIHTGEKAFECQFCNKSFIHFNTYKRHTRIHTGDRPFKCEFCSKTFNERRYFQRHYKIHNEKTLILVKDTTD